MIVYGNTREALESVPFGGMFVLQGRWNCATEGPMHITQPIHIRGEGGMFIAGKSWMEAYGAGSWIDNHHDGAQEAIYYDIPQENQTQGITISDLAIKHSSPTHHAIRMRYTPAAVLERLFLDCKWGRGGIFFDSYTFFMKCRDLIIRSFQDTGVKIVGNGNDYSFYNCDIASAKPAYESSSAVAGIHCVNSGLIVQGGVVDCQNDDRNSASISLKYDKSLRPMAGGSALMTGVYSENSDTAVRIDATPGYQWDGAQIISPHWAMQQHRDFVTGVDVIRGKNVYVSNPQIYDWSQPENVAKFGAEASYCTLEDTTHDLTALYTNVGEENRIIYPAR